MSTRGLTGVTVKNKHYFSYNHSDSYPYFMLQEMAKLVVFLNNNNLLPTLGEKVAKLKEVESEALCTSKELKKYTKYSGKLSGHQKKEYYNLLYKLQGAEWIKQTALGNLDIFIDSNDFIKYSLYCEWAYILNLDTNQLEIYEGKQTKPDIKNKFGVSSIGFDKDTKYYPTRYYPCKLIIKLDLNAIDMSQIEAIINELEKE